MARNAMGSADYSHRLGVLHDAQFAAALERNRLGRFVAAAPVVGGLFGQNVFVTSTDGEFVLRGAPHYDWQFAAEAFFVDLLHRHTKVPVPWPYCIDATSDIFGWPYVLMPRMPGINLADPAVRSELSERDKCGVAAALGDTLIDLQALTHPHYGAYDPAIGTIRAAPGSFADWAIARNDEWIARCDAASDALTAGDRAWIADIVAAARPALAATGAPTFVHHDYKDGNCTFVRVGDTWRVGGVFDLMECYFGDGEEDLVRSIQQYSTAGPARVQAFVDAYRARLPLRAGYPQRLAFYLLADQLVFWEYGQRNHVWFTPGQSFRAYAEPFFAALPR